MLGRCGENRATLRWSSGEGSLLPHFRVSKKRGPRLAGGSYGDVTVAVIWPA